MTRTKREQKAGLSVEAVIASVSATARETAMPIEDFLDVPMIEASPEEEEQMASLVQKAGSVDRAFLTMFRFADYAALSLQAADAQIAQLKKGSDALEGEDYERLDEFHETYLQALFLRKHPFAFQCLQSRPEAARN